MTITAAQNAALKDIIQIILAQNKGRRQLAGMFMELVDRNEWPEYFEVR